VHEAVDDGVPRLLTVARLGEPRKNVDRVLEALARLKGRYAFRYTVVGDGALRGDLEALGRRLGLADCVQFAGFVSREDLMRYYAQSDLFVLVSSVLPESHEGFGIVYLEAAASGVPSLAVRQAGAAEAVADGVSGMYVSESEVGQIEGALAKFLSRERRFDRDECRGFARGFSYGHLVDRALPYYGPAASRFQACG
jgi:phosphatidylinositol alpha-1,6-mannosyltransferase